MYGFNLFSFEFSEDEWFINILTFSWADNKSASLLYLESSENMIGFDIFGLVSVVEFITSRLEKR